MTASGTPVTAAPTGPAPAAAVPLSFAQEILWLAERMHPGSVLDPRCQVHRGFRFEEEPDLELLGRVLSEVVARHDSVRTLPHVDGGALRLEQRQPRPVEVGVEDLDRSSTAAEVRRAVLRAASRPYDLAAGPLLRAVWLAHPPGGVLVLGLHHWAGDDAALDALQRETAELYHRFRHGLPPPPPPPRYEDLARRQRASTNVDAGAVRWWSQELAGASRACLPVPPGRRPSGTTRLTSRRVQPESHRALLGLAVAHNASPYMVLLAAFGALLDGRRTGPVNDSTLFTVYGARSRETRGVVGFLAEPVPLRLKLDATRPLGDAIQQARRVVLAVLAQRTLPFLRLLEAAPRLAVTLLRDGPPTTLLQYFSLTPLDLDGLRGSPLATFQASEPGQAMPTAVPLDLDVTVERRGDEHSIGVLYDPGLWEPTELDTALESLERVLRLGLGEPARPLQELTDSSR